MRSTAAGSVLLAAVLFGTTGTAQALGPDGLSPLGVGAGRIAVGGLLLVLVAVAAGELRSVRTWPPGIVGLLALGVAGYQLAFFAAVQQAGVAVGTIVTIGSAPAFTGLVGALLGQGRPDARWAGATALAVLGVVLIAGGGDGSVRTGGVLLALLAAASYAVYTVAAKRLLDAGRPPVAVMAVGFGLGALLLAPLVPTLATTAGAGGWLVVLYLGVLPTAAAYVLFARGLRHLPAATVATLTLAEPVVAAALGVALLGEAVTIARVAGAALILAGLALLARSEPADSLPL